MNMNLIKVLNDFRSIAEYDNHICQTSDTAYLDGYLIKMLELKEWCGDYILKYAYINERGEVARESYWYYDCQTVLQIEFQDGTILDFISESNDRNRNKKLKDIDITIEDFFEQYIANGYEIDFNFDKDYVELDDIVL